MCAPWKLIASEGDYGWTRAFRDAATEVVVAPSAVHVDHVRQLAKAEIGVAAQNVYVEASGAFTGENRCERTALALLA